MSELQLRPPKEAAFADSRGLDESRAPTWDRQEAKKKDAALKGRRYRGEDRSRTRAGRGVRLKSAAR
jgi:hypothetical protein